MRRLCCIILTQITVGLPPRGKPVGPLPCCICRVADAAVHASAMAVRP